MLLLNVVNFHNRNGPLHKREHLDQAVTPLFVIFQTSMRSLRSKLWISAQFSILFQTKLSPCDQIRY